MFLEAADTTLELIAHRRLIRDLLKRFANRVRYGHVRVAVFGPAGAGKTTLGEFLSGKLDPSSVDYEESISVEAHRLNADWTCTLVVPPGQSRRRERYWPGLYRTLARGEYRGVINVVSFGFQSLEPVEMREASVFQDGMSESEFLAAYREQQLKEEIKISKELAQQIPNVAGKLWMVTLVSKQDLWWEDRQAAQAHYEGGEYAEAVTKIETSKGTQDFQHAFLSASFLRKNFKDGAGRMLKTTSAGYDDALRIVNLGQVVKRFEQWSKEK